MRISNGMLLNTVVGNLFDAQERYLAIQSTASSGKRINKPSDDPTGATKDLRYRANLTSISQFKKNIEQAKSWLAFSDAAIGSVNDLLISAKELAVQLANDTYDGSARQSAAVEMDDIFNQIIDAVNTQYEGNYIFSGTRSDSQPILVNAIGAIYQGNYSAIALESEPSSYLRINSIGADFLTSAVRTLGENGNLNASLQGNLWLDDLHGGNGIEMGNGLFNIRTLNGEFIIDISSSRNLQDVMDSINNSGAPNLSVSISESGAGLRLDDTSTHHITADTPLALLNMGQGVDLTSGQIHFANGAGISLDVDISSASTVGEVIDEINSQLAGAGINNLSVSIDPDENRLIITDLNDPQLCLTVSESSSGSHTAADLGILGEVNGSLIGQEIQTQHFQVSENAAGQDIARDLGILKGTEFGILEGDDLDPRLSYYTLLSSLNNGQGFPMGKIRIVNGHDYHDIDLAPLANDPNATVNDLLDLVNASGIKVEAKINGQGTGITIESTIEGQSLMVMEADGGTTAKDLGIFGSPDILGNMILAKRALENNEVEEINLCLQTFDDGLDRVLVERAEVGGRVNRAELSATRLETFEYQVTEQLSNIEDADMTKVITDMAAAEAVYQSALAATARMIQPSLVDFLN